MEHLKDDLRVWWDLRFNFSLPLTLFGALMMSAITILAYLFSALIARGV